VENVLEVKKMYYCLKCERNHKKETKIAINHLRYKKDLSSKNAINKTVSIVLRDAHTIIEVRKALYQFKNNWSSSDYQSIVEFGACHIINVAPVKQLRMNGFDVKPITLYPKNEDFPIHRISIIKYRGNSYVIDFVLEQFDEYDVSFNIKNVDKCVYKLDEYKVVFYDYILK